jgi:isopenicillin N synthase-like dioxygenase
MNAASLLVGMAPELCRDALPIIDIAPLLHNDVHSRNITSAALHDACVKYGFFYLDISAYVSESEPQDLVELARTFFFLPQDEKDAISLANQDYARGTFGAHLPWFSVTTFGDRICAIERECDKWQGR